MIYCVIVPAKQLMWAHEHRNNLSQEKQIHTIYSAFAFIWGLMLFFDNIFLVVALARYLPRCANARRPPSKPPSGGTARVLMAHRAHGSSPVPQALIRVL